jgi:hypothetical protein
MFFGNHSECLIWTEWVVLFRTINKLSLLKYQLKWSSDFWRENWNFNILLNANSQMPSDKWVSEWLLLTLNKPFLSYIMEKTSYIKWDDDYVCFVLDKHAYLDFYSAGSLKQQSMGRHVAPRGHIILIHSQPVCSLSLMLRVSMRSYN